MTPTSSNPFKPKVLVVDDEKRIRDGCHKMLTNEGFEVARASNGDEGLEMIQKEHFDLILLDLMMPGISGMEVLEKVKALHPHTVVIVITGYATLEHSIDAMKKGAFDFIAKPFSPQDLRMVVSKAIEYINTLQDIAHEKSRIRVLINYLADGVMATDAQKNVALANPAFLKMIGYTGRDVISKPVEEIITDDQLKNMIDSALNAPPSEFVELTEELAWRRPGDKDDTIFRARCVPFRDRIKRNLGTITVLADITTEKKMEQMKSDFVSLVSHEIRGPMNSVLMQIKNLMDGLAGEINDKQEQILSRASERIKSLVSLTSELLDLAKIESGLITQEKESVDMAELMADQAAFHEAKARDKSITLTLEKYETLPKVPANKRNMEEVLTNLITNAINYTPEGGSVKVGAAVENDCLVLSVADNGLGIPAEELDRIFDRFYRVKDEKTRYITGTGLGLPIVKSIVEAHHGSIKVESEPDKGSTFYVYLPLISHE